MIKPQVQFDVKSSIVVFLVALPLCLGVALASGAPLASGLIAGIIGGIVVGFFSSSQVSVSGPAAGLTVIVASGIAQLGSFEKFAPVILLAGLVQILFGLVKGGSIGDYFPTAVIKGMLAAIGLILIIKQLPIALGETSFSLTNIQGNVAFISLLSLTIMLGWDKLAAKGKTFFQLVPGPLIAVLVSILVNEIFHLIGSEGLVHLPAAIFSGLKFPDLTVINFSVVQISLTIAVVASLETLLCIDAAEKIDPFKRKTDKNKELLAQGVGNALSGLLGGLPITAVIVRSSANVAAGARTKYSAIFHGCWILICVLLIPNFLNLIPLATLACVLLLVGYKLTKPVFFVEMWHRGWHQLIIFSVTIGVILATDLLKGIFCGLALAILFELRAPGISCLEVVHEDDKVHFKFIKDVSFLHKAAITKMLNELSEGKCVYFHGMQLVRIHVDVHELISDYQEEAKKKNREVFFI
ncbi:MAG: SulP family inorganic anion transporter [Bacteriovoracaceae bacterium]|nr:SulP family inorganic anion transporter [Bacteriovoracaceae bacterium]